MFRRLSLFVFLIMIGIIGSTVVTQVEVIHAQPPFGTVNWQAQFFNNTTFTAPVVATTTYSALNFNWPGAPTLADNVTPVPGVQADNFSVRFTRGPVSVAAGTYRFTMTADDRATLRINNVVIIDITTPGETRSADILLQTPTQINLVVDFIEISGPAILQLQDPTITGAPPGVPPGGPTLTPTVTPRPTITPLPPIPPGAITATVIRAAVLNVRDAPSLGGNRLGRILRGERYAIVGRDTDARWFLLQLGGYQAWAYGYYLFVDGNEFTPPIVSGNTVLGLAGQPDYGVRAQTRATVRLRAQPNVASEQTGRITWGAFLPVIGRTADGYWYQVVWRNTVGWAYSPFVQVIEGDINNVPVR